MVHFNLKLQVADPEYTSRASANQGHFLVTRSSNDLREYLRFAVSAQSVPNAIGNYAYYHVAALALARGYIEAPDLRARPGATMLATEAFALHFLQDTFSAGHVAGTWGNVAERKGTHDFYCELGLDTSAWNGERMVILGDAHIRDAEVHRIGAAVAESLSQVYDAAENPSSASARVAAEVSPEWAARATLFDSCTAQKQAPVVRLADVEPLILAMASRMPIPGKGEQDVHLPRYRQELGPFVGFSGDLSGGSSFGGFGSSGAPRVMGSSNVGFRFGVGLEALTGSSGSAQAFIGLGLQYETAQFDTGSSAFQVAGVPPVPSRRGWSLRLRVPFYLFPFDLLLAAPILVWMAPDTLTDMAIVAASGGRLGLHRAIVTKVGSFQLLLGSEVGLTLYGYLGGPVENLSLAAPDAVVPYNSRAVFISFRSPQVDIPVFEYRPLRTFATQQALTFALQFGFGFEIPNQVEYVSKLTLSAATGPTPDLGMAWIAYLRIHFDARYYF